MSYSFLTKPKWIALFLIMVLASVACIFLGRWQMSRYHEKVEAAEQVTTTYDNAPVALDEVGDVDASEQWQLVEVTGSYREDQVLLRGRSVAGAAAIRVINLFDTVDGRTIIVDRGWIPLIQAEGEVGEAGFVPALPAGEQTTLLARARPSEQSHNRVPAEGFIYTLNTDQVLDGMGITVPNIIDGRFEAEPGMLGSDAEGAPQPYPRPSTSLGNHLAYAWEWWFFAFAAQLVVPILARREAQENSWVIDGVDLRELNLTDQELADLGITLKAKPAKKRSDEEIEDALLDEMS